MYAVENIKTFDTAFELSLASLSAASLAARCDTFRRNSLFYVFRYIFMRTSLSLFVRFLCKRLFFCRFVCSQRLYQDGQRRFLNSALALSFQFCSGCETVKAKECDVFRVVYLHTFARKNSRKNANGMTVCQWYHKQNDFLKNVYNFIEMCVCVVCRATATTMRKLFCLALASK